MSLEQKLHIIISQSPKQKQVSRNVQALLLESLGPIFTLYLKFLLQKAQQQSRRYMKLFSVLLYICKSGTKLTIRRPLTFEFITTAALINFFTDLPEFLPAQKHPQAQIGAKQKSPLKIECFHLEGRCLKSKYTSLFVRRSAQSELFRFEGSLAF